MSEKKYDGRANLKPVKPGEKLPGAGRKKGSKNLKTTLRRCMDVLAKEGHITRELKNDEDYSPIMGIVAIAYDPKSSLETKLKAFEKLLEHTEGKAVQRVEVGQVQDVILNKDDSDL